jgi:hypothetical protein
MNDLIFFLVCCCVLCSHELKKLPDAYVPFVCLSEGEIDPKKL